MNTLKQPYEAPTLRCNGDVVEHTHACIIRKLETDLCPLSLPGSVGYGV
jgi:hypothetical protein